jgi:mersacidin/lichenicidin family type 2 lantibiotic
MNPLDIVRAWKDAEHRQSLSSEEQALLPEHPAGAIELIDEELDQAAGGGDSGTWSCCPMISCLSCGGPDCQTQELA